MKENIERETEYLKFTDWLDRVLRDEYKTEKFINAAFAQAEAIAEIGNSWFELAQDYTKDHQPYVYSLKELVKQVA